MRTWLRITAAMFPQLTFCGWKPNNSIHARQARTHAPRFHGPRPLLSTEIGTSKTGSSSDRISDPAIQQIAVRQTGSVSAEWREILLHSPKSSRSHTRTRARDADKDETGFTMEWGYVEMSLNGSSFKLTHKHKHQ